MRMNLKTSCLVGAVAAVAFVSFGSSPAQAYGPEGMFGGRPMPDNTIVLGNPTELKNDRPERAQSVLDHPRADYDPAAIPLGSFEMFPTLEMGTAYDSNIYATHSEAESDSISTARPILGVFSNWNRHALSLTSYGDMNFYADHNLEDYDNSVVDVNGRYDIMSQTWVAARGGYQHLSEPRGSADATNGSKPGEFDVKTGGLSFYRGVGVLKATVDYDYKRLVYDEIETPTGDVSQRGRDRSEQVVGGKLGYDVSPNFRPYIKSSYNWHLFDHNNAHKSDGYDAFLGSTMDFGGITSLDLFAGFQHQEFQNFAGNKSVTEPRFGARLDWNVTGLTTVVLETARTMEQTNSAGASHYMVTGGSLTVTHELKRNILLEADGGYAHNRYAGISTDRDDHEISAGLGGRYLFNRNFYADLLYNWNERLSSEALSEYDRHLVSLRVGARM